jgi:hypothetical protein
MRIPIFRDVNGVWQFHEGPGGTPVYAELRGGVRIEGLDGRTRIFAPPGLTGMSVDEAVRAGILQIPVVED